MTEPKEPEKCSHDCGDYWSDESAIRVFPKCQIRECPFCKREPAKERDQVRRWDSEDVVSYIDGIEQFWIREADYEAAMKAKDEVFKSSLYEHTDVIKALSSALDEEKKELEIVRKRFDERNVTPNEHAKYLIELPLREKLDAANKLNGQLYFEARARIEAERIALTERDELKANIASMEGQDHADRCAQSKRLKLQLEELVKERDAFKKALKEYGRHKGDEVSGCGCDYIFQKLCICGLDVALGMGGKE